MVRQVEDKGADGGLTDGEPDDLIYRHRFAIIAALVVFTALLFCLFRL